MVDAAHPGCQLHQLLEREHIRAAQIESLANRLCVLQAMRDGAGHIFHPHGLKARRCARQLHEWEYALQLRKHVEKLVLSAENHAGAKHSQIQTR